MSAASSRPVRFLLIEDDEDHAHLVRRAMRENRVANELEHVSDGEQAIEFLRQQGKYSEAKRPDIVLLDLKLPRLDGHEVLHEIKSDESLKTIPVVVLTTSQTEIDRAKAYAAHANSYLVKPVDFERFHTMIQELNLYWSIWNALPAPAH